MPEGADISSIESASPARAAESGRIDYIEILRAFAIMFVILEQVRINLFHWNLPALNHLAKYFEFWSGVDLFLAISGFVIARSLLPQLAVAKNPTAFINATLCFWVRRAWRLLPSAWLWLLLIQLATAFFNRSEAFGLFHTNFQSAVASILDVANLRSFLLAANHEWFGPAFPYWSLSLEEQFYFLLPFLVLASGRYLVIVSGILVLSQLFLPRLHSPLIMVRSDALLLGVLIAVWSKQSTFRLFQPVALSRYPAARWATLILVLGSIAALSPIDTPLIPFPVGIIALLSAALVVIASYDQDYLMRKGAFKSALLWVGSRSYALYLVHIPSYLMTREIWYRIEPVGTIFTGRFTLRFALTALALMLTLAELNYRLIERPLRMRGAQIARRLAMRIPQGNLQPSQSVTVFPVALSS